MTSGEFRVPRQVPERVGEEVALKPADGLPEREGEECVGGLASRPDGILDGQARRCDRLAATAAI